MKRILLLTVCMACLCLPRGAPAEAAPMVVTYRAAESVTDRRYDYDTAVLRLALEKTRAKWGDYRLQPSPRMNFSRALKMLHDGTLENPMFKLSASDSLCRRLECAPFPVDLGIVGYRMFFVSPKVDEELTGVRDVDDLKEFSFGQGVGWLDVDILRAAGFRVLGFSSYEALFRLVALGRFDLLSRGVNEVEQEYHAHSGIRGLTLNRTLGLKYPLPRFFFSDKEGVEAAQRVHEGLVMAYEDGSLKRLWDREYRSSLEFAGFGHMRFLAIDNPLVKGLSYDYEKYFVSPEEYGAAWD